MTYSDPLEKDTEIANQLQRTWPVFFNKFGRLTEVQRQTIPLILRGDDTLVCAPTASGKTEAVCAPLLERNLSRQDNWTILYVSPTRALVNDLYERLVKPLDVMGLRIARRTGDHHDTFQNARILITTPESFDSMLCRGKLGNEGHMLANVVAVVLDEIHFLLGNSRGEHLRWLLERLRRLHRFAKKKGWTTQEDSFQTATLSATVSSPESVCRTYLGPSAHEINVRGERSLETIEVDSSDPSTEHALTKYVEHLEKPEKVLVFCNTRKRVDTLSTTLNKMLSKYGYMVRAHHGSLSKKLRETAENSMRTEDKVILFATSTLEIGIDIGDIDLIVLDGPASDIQTLLQRMGRGNRRTNKTRVMACSGNIAEVLIHSAMIECARNGEMTSLNYGPCYTVTRQQIASYIFQSPKRSRRRETLEGFLESCISPSIAQSVLGHLLQQVELIEDRDGIRLGETWLDRSERGQIHSNIEGTYGITVVDEKTGDQIAQGVSFSGGETIQIGGAFLKVKKWDERKMEVSKIHNNKRADAKWGYCCRSWAKGSGQPEALRRYLGFSEHEWPVLEKDTGVFVFHFGGGRRRAVIEMILELNPEATKSTDINEWFLTLPAISIDKKPEWLTSFGAATLEISIEERVDKLERSLGRPSSNKYLPIDLRVDEVRHWLQLELELKNFQESHWTNVTDNDITNALSTLIKEFV